MQTWPRTQAARTQVWLCSPTFRKLALLQPTKIHYTLDVYGLGGGFEIEMPRVWPRSLARPGAKIVIERSVAGQMMRIEDAFVHLSQPEQQSGRGTRWADLSGPNLTAYYLGKPGRVVDRDQSEAGASYTLASDDAAGQFVLDHLGVGAESGRVNASGRDLSAIVGFTVAPRLSQGPSITQDGFGRQLADVLADIRKKSEQAGKRLYWWCRLKAWDPPVVEFVTKVDYLGRDRRLGVAANPVILAPEMGTVETVDLEQDWTEGYSSVAIKYLSPIAQYTRITDTARRGAWADAYREVLYDDQVSGSATEAQGRGQATLQAGKDRDIARLKVRNSFAVMEGADYGLGDLATGWVMGRRKDYEITGVDRTIEGGAEASTIRVEER